MKNTSESLYWTLQPAVWEMLLTSNLFVSSRVGLQDWKPVVRSGFYLVLGVSVSHLMRLLIRRTRLVPKPLYMQLPSFVLLTSVFSAL